MICLSVKLYIVIYAFSVLSVISALVSIYYAIKSIRLARKAMEINL